MAHDDPVEGHRAAWLTLGGVVVAAAISQALTVWATMATNPTVHPPLWLLILPLIYGLLGLYPIVAVIWGLPLPHKRAKVLGRPIGGGIPMQAPVDYQVAALRQLIAKVAETQTVLDFQILTSVLRNHPRFGTDPVYEPLHTISIAKGLAELVKNGELEEVGNWQYRIVSQGARRSPRFSIRGRQRRPPSQGSEGRGS